MKKTLTILLLAMLVVSMPIAMAETTTETIEINIAFVGDPINDPTNTTMQIWVQGTKLYDDVITSKELSYETTYTYTCSNSTIDTSTLETNIINAIKAEMAAQNYTVVWNETTFQQIVNNEVQTARADEQAWIENTWMKTQQDYENVTAERDEWKLEAARLQTELNQYTGANSIPTQLENKISDLEKTLWAAGAFILILCIALVYFILMVVKPGMGRLLKKGGDN